MKSAQFYSTIAAIIFLAVPVQSMAQQPEIVRPQGMPVKVQLDAMPIGALVTLLMRDVMRVPYVISSDVLQDNRPYSVNLVMPRADLPVRVVRLLRSLGFTVRIIGGAVHVSRAGGPGAGNPNGQFSSAPSGTYSGASATMVSVPSGSPVVASHHVPVSSSQAASNEYSPAESSPVPVSETDQHIALIRFAHRPTSEIGDTLLSVFPNLTISVRGASDPQGTYIIDRATPDTLVIAGAEKVVDQAVALAVALDVARPMVSIDAVLLDVRTSMAKGSALSILANALGGRIKGASLTDAVIGSQSFTLALGGIEAVLSAVNSDGRFEVVAKPVLSALSGTTATINSGAKVPTIGAVTFGENAQPIRSVEYRDSGVTLSVSPIVRQGEIYLSVKQERSNFVATTSGVNDSPTLITSSASADVAIRDGETVVIAGLDEESTNRTREGIFGGLLGSRKRSKDSSQLLLLIQAQVDKDERNTKTLVTRIKPTKSAT